MAPVAEAEVIKLKDQTLVIKMQRRNSGGPKPKNDEEIDFEERQKIAHAYADSVNYKAKLRYVLMLHICLLFLVFIKVLDFCLRMIGLDQDWFTEMEFPAPSPWEFAYMFSLVPVAYSSGAMPYNNDALMTKSYYYTFFLSIIPLVVGAGCQLPDIFVYIGDPDNAINNMPMFSTKVPLCIVWYMYFIIALQVHALHMYLAYKLVCTWSPLNPLEKKLLLKKNQ